MKKVNLIKKLKEAEKDLRVSRASRRATRVHAFKDLTSFSTKNYTGSGVVVTVTDINSHAAEKSVEFMINDGLPTEVVTELQKAIRSSLKLEESLFKLPAETAPVKELDKPERGPSSELFVYGGVAFDDTTIDDDANRWSQMCKKCINNHRKALKGAAIGNNDGSGICGVAGCMEESNSYVDFPVEDGK